MSMTEHDQQIKWIIFASFIEQDTQLSIEYIQEFPYCSSI